MPKKSLRSVVDLFAAPRDPARRASVRPMVEALERRDLPSAATLLHISSNGRFLVDANNQPFYLVGDAAWTLPAGITTGSASNPNTANYYFQTRANEGYNAVLMDADVLLGASPVGAPSRGPLDANGNPPFDAYLPGTSTYDVSTPDTAYWNNVYNIVSTAGQYGIQVLLEARPAPGTTLDQRELTQLDRQAQCLRPVSGAEVCRPGQHHLDGRQ